jgi:hypothetical protein
MTLRRLWLASLCLTAATALGPGLSMGGVVVDVDVAPPAPQVEVVPAARPGYIWSPGFWDWSGHNHVWVRGHWIRERPGWHWVPDRWVASGPRWHHDVGHLER